MSLQNIDFQALLHQHISQIVHGWQQQAVPQDKAEELAGQLFNMGMIAAQQMIQAPEIQVEKAPVPIEITPPMAEKITVIFIYGLSAAYLLWYQLGIPQQEGMEILQNTALYIFEQSKQMTSAAFAAPNNADGFKDEQMIQWLSQTSQEAFQYYLTELEKQRGPIARVEPVTHSENIQPLVTQIEADNEEDSWGSLESLTLANDTFEEKRPEPAIVQPEIQVEHTPQIQGQQQALVSDSLYQTIATALVLSVYPEDRKQLVFRALDASKHQDLIKYQDAHHIPNNIDFKKLSQFVKQAKIELTHLLSRYPKSGSYYRKKIGQFFTKGSQLNLNQLFEMDRSNIQYYISQFNMDTPNTNKQPILPPGVMQSILDFLEKTA